MAQGVDIGDRFTANGDHRRDIDQHPSPVMARGEPSPGHRARQRISQPRPVSQQPDRHTPGVGHHAGPVPRHRQPRRPRCTLHLPGAFPLENLNSRKYKYLVAGQALWCIPGACQPLDHERPRLAVRDRVDHDRQTWAVSYRARLPVNALAKGPNLGRPGPAQSTGQRRAVGPWARSGGPRARQAS